MGALACAALVAAATEAMKKSVNIRRSEETGIVCFKLFMGVHPDVKGWIRGIPTAPRCERRLAIPSSASLSFAPCALCLFSLLFYLMRVRPLQTDQPKVLQAAFSS